MLAAGCTLAECERIRHLDRSAIVDHLRHAADAGYNVEVSWMLDDAQHAALRELMGEPEEIRLSRLSRVLDSSELELIRRCYDGTTAPSSV